MAASENFSESVAAPTPVFVPFDLRCGRGRYIDCYKDAWRVAHGSLAGFDADACWKGALTRAADSPEALTEIRLQDAFVGVLALDERRGSFRRLGWIAFLYISPEFRGMGYGRALLARAEARFAALGRRAVRLTVAPGNPALRFYEHLGYACVGTERGALEDINVMEKKL